MLSALLLSALVSANGGDLDEHGCKQSAGFSYCAALERCVQLWVTPCDAANGGGDRDEHGCVQSAGYAYCASTQKCVRPWETPCKDLAGDVDVALALQRKGGDRDEHGCVHTAGYTYCAALRKCVRPWETPCQDEAANGGGFGRDAHGCITSAGYSYCEATQKCARPWEEPCADTAANGGGFDRDEHGCITSAGYSFCASAQKCVRSWEEPCVAVPASCPARSFVCTAGAPQNPKLPGLDCCCEYGLTAEGQTCAAPAEPAGCGAESCPFEAAACREDQACAKCIAGGVDAGVDCLRKLPRGLLRRHAAARLLLQCFLQKCANALLV